MNPSKPATPPSKSRAAEQNDLDMLTPDEIEDLRCNARAAIEYGLMAFAHLRPKPDAPGNEPSGNALQRRKRHGPPRQ